MKDKLSRIRSPWRRLLITLVVSFVAITEPRRSYRPRARVHWVGGYERPRRPERAVLLALCISAVVMFSTHQHMLWLVSWGGAVSAFVIVHSFNLIARTMQGG